MFFNTITGNYIVNFMFFADAGYQGAPQREELAEVDVGSRALTAFLSEPQFQQTGHPAEVAIHPQYLAQQISHFAADDAIFTCDVGTPTVWPAGRGCGINGRSY